MEGSVEGVVLMDFSLGLFEGDQTDVACDGVKFSGGGRFGGFHRRLARSRCLRGSIV